MGEPVDYKTLFMGACSVVVFLGGGMVSLWNHSSDQSNTEKRNTDERQWEHIGRINDSVIEHRADISSTLRHMADLEARVLALERRAVLHAP